MADKRILELQEKSSLATNDMFVVDTYDDTYKIPANKVIPDLTGYRTASEQDVIDEGKQDVLTAGDNITIENNVISAVSSEQLVTSVNGEIGDVTLTSDNIYSEGAMSSVEDALWDFNGQLWELNIQLQNKRNNPQVVLRLDCILTEQPTKQGNFYLFNLSTATDEDTGEYVTVEYLKSLLPDNTMLPGDIIQVCFENGEWDAGVINSSAETLGLSGNDGIAHTIMFLGTSKSFINWTRPGDGEVVIKLEPYDESVISEIDSISIQIIR